MCQRMSCVSLFSKERVAYGNPLLCTPRAQRGVIATQIPYLVRLPTSSNSGVCAQLRSSWTQRLWDNDACDLCTVLIFPFDTIMDPTCQPLGFLKSDL